MYIYNMPEVCQNIKYRFYIYYFIFWVLNQHKIMHMSLQILNKYI